MTGQASIARLAFWARNMTAIRDANMSWPGFSYSDAEWSRMRALAAAVTPKAFASFVTWTTVIFLAVAALGVVGIFMPLLLLLFPDPEQTSAWKFAALLAACAFLILSLGLALSMALAARWSADAAMHAQLAAAAEDAALASKVDWQINRMALLVCGALVPGMLLFIAYDIDAGPLITALKWTAGALVLGSMAVAVLRQPK